MPLLCSSCHSASDDELKMQFENSGKIYLFANLHSILHNEILHHIIYTTCACDDVERFPYTFLVFGCSGGQLATDRFMKKT